MSLAQDVKKAFTDHADDVSPDPGTWETVAKRLRRQHKNRLILLATAVGVLVLVLAILLPMIGTSRKPSSFIGGPSPAASPSQTPTPFAARTTLNYFDAEEGWALQSPGWNSEQVEDYTDFYPSSLSPLSKNGRTFAVSIKLDSAFDPNGLTPTETTVASKHALRYGNPNGGPNGGELIFRIPRWNADPEQDLILLMQATSLELWDRYSSKGLGLIRSLVDARGFDFITHENLSTRYHGAVNPEIRIDDRTALLLRYMDARMKGAGAEQFLTTTAQDQYSSAGCLYTEGPSGKPWGIYGVVGRHDGAATTFNLDLFKSSDIPTGYETIVVGPTAGAQNLLVLSVEARC